MSPDLTAQLIPLRLALGLGDQELEQRLRPALEAADDVRVVAPCLAADQVLAAVDGGEVDMLVLAWGLHRLTDSALAQLERTRLPIVLLVPDAADERWHGRRVVVLPFTVEPGPLREAIRVAARGERPVLERPRGAPQPTPSSTQPRAAEAEPAPLSILAVAGGAGSPGRTTVALNLATALGAVAPTVLVDGDFSNPSIAAYLSRDPSRNLCTLAHAVRERPHAWASTLSQELQPLDARSTSGVVLCGLPKPELRTSVPPAILERLPVELARMFRYVVLDIGADILGLDAVAVAHRALLGAAQHVLLVTASDLVGLWHARTLLGQLERLLEIDRTRISLVINRHDGRYHHPPTEIEWHLGAAAAAVVPFDYAPAQRAVADQRPLVVADGGRATRALLELAGRVHQGQVRLPVPSPEPRTRAGWLSWPLKLMPARAAAGPNRGRERS